MGNCAASQHGGESWADGDEWEEEASASASSEEDHHERREHVSSEVTIRITKRQLHELMEMKGAGGSGNGRRSVRHLLADIMNSGEVHHHDQHREPHWKPALQSIPEAVES